MSRIWIALLGFMLLPALAAGASSSGAPQGNPRLAHLQIEIWPEFDRPAALVILKGELSADVALPVAVSVRIAASSGGPAAVASSAGPSAGLSNVKYERKDARDFITLKFDSPERLFQVEFYDALATSKPERSYTYVWPGDLAADRVTVILQEPAAAGDFSVQPNLDAAATGEDGLRYRSANLGTLEAGRQLPIKVRYTKTDSRTSAEILPPKTPDSKAPNLSLAQAAGSGEGLPDSNLLLGLSVAAAVAAIGTGATLLWTRRRRTEPGGAGFCAQCGVRPSPGDRFCSKCGAPLG